jgi:hypothetical protein
MKTEDPRVLLVEKMVSDVLPMRSLVAFNESFEKTQIRGLADVVPAMFTHKPELVIKKLKIQNGGMAMDAFAMVRVYQQ